MSKPRRTETLPAEPLRTDDGGLLLSPPVCASCRVRAVRVVAYTNEQGAKAYRASTSCEDCQRAAFGGGGSAPAAPAVVEVPSALPPSAQKLYDSPAAMMAELWPCSNPAAPVAAPADLTRPENLRAGMRFQSTAPGYEHVVCTFGGEAPAAMAGDIARGMWRFVGFDLGLFPRAARAVRPVHVAIPAAPISETPPAPRPVVPLTAGETVSALSASLDRVAAPPSVTAADLSRHAVRMRKAGLAPVTRETCDPHERRLFGGLRGGL